jgi:hypothetical protein
MYNNGPPWQESSVVRSAPEGAVFEDDLDDKPPGMAIDSMNTYVYALFGLLPCRGSGHEIISSPGMQRRKT